LGERGERGGLPEGRAAGLHVLGGPGRRAPRLLVPPGAEREPAAPRPLLVFFHGAGGTGEQALPLLRGPAAERDVLVLLPTSEGPTWDLLRGGTRDAAAVEDALREVGALHPVDRVAYGGFSDGGSYALSLGLAAGERVEALLAFSPGFAAPPSRSGRPRVWVSHGTDDAVLPVERCGRVVVRDLRALGHDVRYAEFPGGHVVLPELVDEALGWWLGGGRAP
jgi:predicted esterase